VNIKTDDNYYYYAGYSTQYGYKKRTPRGPRGKQATSRAATSALVVSENETEGQTIEEPNLETQESPKITFVRPPQGEDRF
jgi:histidyl-tRNA synthetase